MGEMFFVKETPYIVSALERVMLKVWNRHQKGLRSYSRYIRAGRTSMTALEHKPAQNLGPHGK